MTLGIAKYCYLKALIKKKEVYYTEIKNFCSSKGSTKIVKKQVSV